MSTSGIPQGENPRWKTSYSEPEVLFLTVIETGSHKGSTGKLAQPNGWGVMVSHRSGETEGTLITHLVVDFCTGHIKTGGL